MQLTDILFQELEQLVLEYQTIKADIERLGREKNVVEQRTSLLRELLQLEEVSLLDDGATTP